MFKRDHGVCALCGLDTEYLRRTVRWMEQLAERRWHFGKDCTGQWPRWDDRLAWYGDPRAQAALEQLAFQFFGRRSADWSSHLWEADHIVPVIEGGGECGLSGLRTLCRPCHKHETAQLARRRAHRYRRGPAELQAGLFLDDLAIAT